jgi:glutaredoxin
VSENWPKCPDCGLTLIYCTAENIRAFSCACGYSKKAPGFLEQMGIDTSELDLDSADVQPKEGESGC